MHTRDVGGRRWLDAVAVVGLVGWLALDLTARTVFGSSPWPESVVDYRIMYESGYRVWETHRYPHDYPYPPAAAAAHAATTALPFPTAAALWLAATGLAAAACYFLIARTLGLAGRTGALILLPLAHTAAAYYFQWDMRSVNCNLLVLAAVLFGAAARAGGRDASAGFWFALAAALKVLPVLLVPYLLWSRRPRAFGWAVAWSAVFWVGVPLVAFGPDGFGPVYSGWAGEMTRSADPALLRNHPILISLPKAAAFAFGDGTAGAKAVVLVVCASWVLVGAVAAISCRRRSGPGSGGQVLTDVSLLVLAPAAVSHYLEPYHVVAVCVPAAVLLAAATDTGLRLRLRSRLLAVAAVAAGVLVLTFAGPWPLRGLVVNAQLLLLCSAAVWVSRNRPTPVIHVATRRLGTGFCRWAPRNRPAPVIHVATPVPLPASRAAA